MAQPQVRVDWLLGVILIGLVAIFGVGMLCGLLCWRTGLAWFG